MHLVKSTVLRYGKHWGNVTALAITWILGHQGTEGNDGANALVASAQDAPLAKGGSTSIGADDLYTVTGARLLKIKKQNKRVTGLNAYPYQGHLAKEAVAKADNMSAEITSGGSY